MTSILDTPDVPSMPYSIMHPNPTELERERRRDQKLVLSAWSYAFVVAGTLGYGAARAVVREETVSSALKIGLTATAALLLGLGFWRVERELLASDDELQQRMRLEAAVLTLPIACGILLFIGTLEHGGIRLLKPVHYWIPPFYTYLVTLFFVRRRYR